MNGKRTTYRCLSIRPSKVVSTRNVYVGLFSISKILSSRHNHYYSVGGTALWYTTPLWLLQMMELDITMHSMH